MPKHILIVFFSFLQLVVLGQIEPPKKEIKLYAPNVDLPDSSLFNDTLILKSIRITGNKKTKERIILRELSFGIGDTLFPGKIKLKLVSSRQNLQNTSLFNFVIITPETDANDLTLIIHVVERWYTWPAPMFELAETNFNTWWLTKDWNRTYYGMYLVQENFRGLRESVKLKMQFGYSEQFALQYTIPFLNKNQTIGAGISTSYSRNKEISYLTINNKRIFYRDFNTYVRDEFYTRLLLTYRKNIYNTHTVQLKYNAANINDTLTKISDHYFSNNSNHTKYMVLGYEFKKDHRDVKAYPLKGFYFETEAVKVGAALFKNEPEFFYLIGDFRKYWKLNPKWYYAFKAKTKINAWGSQPYYLQKGLGYGNDVVRSYEYYVLDGQNWYLGKSSLKYQLIAPTVQKFNFLGNDKVNTFHYAFYLNAFIDAGYVKDKVYHQLNPMSNTFLLGYGIGLDYVTYYDQTIRFEYSFNKLGQHGFFLNVSAPL